MTENIAQQLYNYLFAACDIMRGPINQDDYKTYITPLLFFKRISDEYDEEYDRALEESDGDEEYAAFPEQHAFVVPEGCHWKDVRNTTVNIGAAIVNAMNGIERANPQIHGIFSSFDEADWTNKTKLTDERLKDLIEHMSTKRLRNSDYSADIMGDAYEYLLKKFADMSKKNAGEFYTPRTIVRLCVLLLDPKEGESVYDPACGTGGMLIEAIKYMHNDKLSYGKVFGQEKNLSTAATAEMNLYLHGKKDVTVTQGDTLRHPNYIENGKLRTFNCVLANPPFSLKKWGSDIFSSDPYGRNIWGTPSDNCADFAWLQHMVKSMDEDNGRCAVILPQGVLFHGGADGKMRQKLIESDLLDCVITLASGVFYSTGVSACILYLNNHKPASHKGKICLVNAESIYTAQRAQNIMTEDDVNRVFKLYTDYQDVIDYAKVVTINEIKDKDYTLAVNTYIEKAKAETKDPAQVRAEFFVALEDVKVKEERMKQLLREGGYLND